MKSEQRKTNLILLMLYKCLSFRFDTDVYDDEKKREHCLLPLLGLAVLALILDSVGIHFKLERMKRIQRDIVLDISGFAFYCFTCIFNNGNKSI